MASNPPTICLDPLFGIADIFSECGRSARQAPLNRVIGSSEKEMLTVRGPRLLSDADQSVYFAIVSLISDAAGVANADSRGAVDRKLWRRLGGAQSSILGEVGVASVSWRKLARLAGFEATGDNVSALVDRSLRRLSRTQVIREINGFAWSSQLIACIRTRKNRVHLAIDPRATQIARGIRCADGRLRQYVSLSLRERTQLETPVARIAHAWLGAWASSGVGRERRIGLEKLADHVWCDTPHRTTVKRRRVQLRKALADINKVTGWLIVTDGDMCSLTRSPSGKPSSRQLELDLIT